MKRKKLRRKKRLYYEGSDSCCWQGTRMGPLTQNMPKVMLPVANKPLLSHVILSAREAGIKEFVLVVGYHAETVKEYFGDGSEMDVSTEYAHQKRD